MAVISSKYNFKVHVAVLPSITCISLKVSRGICKPNQVVHSSLVLQVCFLHLFVPVAVLNTPNYDYLTL